MIRCLNIALLATPWDIEILIVGRRLHLSCWKQGLGDRRLFSFLLSLMIQLSFFTRLPRITPLNSLIPQLLLRPIWEFSPSSRKLYLGLSSAKNIRYVFVQKVFANENTAGANKSNGNLLAMAQQKIGSAEMQEETTSARSVCKKSNMNNSLAKNSKAILISADSTDLLNVFRQDDILVGQLNLGASPVPENNPSDISSSAAKEATKIVTETTSSSLQSVGKHTKSTSGDTQSSTVSPSNLAAPDIQQSTTVVDNSMKESHDAANADFAINAATTRNSTPPIDIIQGTSIVASTPQSTLNPHAIEFVRTSVVSPVPSAPSPVASCIEIGDSTSTFLSAPAIMESKLFQPLTQVGLQINYSTFDQYQGDWESVHSSDNDEENAEENVEEEFWDRQLVRDDSYLDHKNELRKSRERERLEVQFRRGRGRPPGSRRTYFDVMRTFITRSTSLD